MRKDLNKYFHCSPSSVIIHLVGLFSAIFESFSHGFTRAIDIQPFLIKHPPKIADTHDTKLIAVLFIRVIPLLAPVKGYKDVSYKMPRNVAERYLL